MVLGCNSPDEKKIAAETGINPYFLKENIRAAKLYSQQGIEKALLLLHRYNLKSIGIGDAGTEDSALLKELVIKIVN
jgi:DNA polymerase III subunit delta